MPRIDVVIAVRNEEQNIPIFLDDVEALALPRDIAIKVLFIEDSSTDGTRVLLRRLSRERPDVGYCTLTRSFGQGMAVAYGLSRSNADAMIMMDVDGSHPIRVIPEMISGYLAGAKVVQCVRRTLVNRSTYRRVGTAIFQLGARALTGVDTREQNIYFRLVTSDVARSLLQPRYWNYLRFPLPRRPEGVLRLIEVDTEERKLGQSKYDFRRLVNLAIDAVVSLMSSARLTTILLAGALVVGLLLRARWWAAASMVALGMAWMTRRWAHLHRSDTLRRIEILEEGNVP